MNPAAPTGRLGYAGNALDRGLEERDDTTLARALQAPGALFRARSGNRWLTAAGAQGTGPALSLTQVRALGGAPEDAVLLGWSRSDGSPRLAIELAAEVAEREPDRAVDLREAGSAERFDASTEGELAQAAHLLNWHRTAKFCGVCGAPARSALAGYRRDCTACGHMQFPRTDPVVIMLVHDGEGACVLGRQARFAPGVYSCLAGFVEPGETIEDAVRREIAEEVGLTVGRVDYALSQPWPFPGSLMIGCIAEARRGPLRVQESELEDARWFERSELSAMLEGTHVDGLSTPPAFAIARHLADLWRRS